MSENLKRAESLFNRIMNQNGSQAQFKPSVHGGGGHGHGGAHHGHSTQHHRRYRHELLSHPAMKLPPAILAEVGGAGMHVLAFCWTVQFFSRYRKKDYGDEKHNSWKSTKDVDFPTYGRADVPTRYIATLEQMWLALATLRKATEVSLGTEFFVFKSGINPAWEDPFNTRGGRWVFKFSRRHADTDAAVARVRARTGLVWERLVLRLLGGSLVGADHPADVVATMLSDINGVVLSVRRDEDLISLWNSNLGFRNKKVTAFQGRRILCDAILRVIRECDAILAGADAVATTSTGSERVRGVSFEYRLHADYKGDGEKFKSSRPRRDAAARDDDSDDE